jgi:two-component system response regulator FixJ
VYVAIDPDEGGLMAVNTVHIVDDDPAVRDSMALLLATESFEVRTHAAARDFLAATTSHDTGCVVTDVRMPEMTGIELLQEMNQHRPGMRAIVVTAHADVPLAVEAMKLGAIDLLEKPFDDDALLTCVRGALAQMNAENARHAETQTIEERLATLTGRENEVLGGLLKGQPNKIIAHELGISVRTVEVHRANVMAKMQARNLAELVRMALVAPSSRG